MLHINDLNAILAGVTSVLGVEGDSTWSYLKKKEDPESWSVAETMIGAIQLRIHLLDDFYLLNIIQQDYQESGIIRNVDAYIPYDSEHSKKGSILAEAYKELYLEG